MNDKELDRILSEEMKILPSSGFTIRVMDRVRQEASAPPPIAFPWIRAVPGFGAGACLLAWLVFAGIPKSGTTRIAAWNFQDLLARWTPLLREAERTCAGWIVLALLLALLSAILPIRIIHRRA